MATSKVYRNAPLVLSVLELTHPQHEITSVEAQAIKTSLQADLPLLETDRKHELTLDLTSGIAPQTIITTWHRFISRDRRTMLSCSPRSTLLETTNYQGWESFLPLFERGLRARLECSGLDGVDRIGLRYIDEVRIPSAEAVQWDKWVRSDLLPPNAEIDGLAPAQQQSVVQYNTDHRGMTITMRYGVTDGPSGVSGALRPNPPSPGPYFLFDTDSVWTLPNDEPTPEPQIDRLAETADLLHTWSKSLFEWWPTTALREEVFDAG